MLTVVYVCVCVPSACQHAASYLPIFFIFLTLSLPSLRKDGSFVSGRLLFPFSLPTTLSLLGFPSFIFAGRWANSEAAEAFSAV